jgi:hypothetical protein
MRRAGVIAALSALLGMVAGAVMAAPVRSQGWGSKWRIVPVHPGGVTLPHPNEGSGMSEQTSQRPPADDSANPGSVWFKSLGEIVTPLLAGFAVTTLIVVSDDAGKLRWPGAAIIALALAAIVLIVAVQCAYHGRAWFNEAAVHDADRDEWQPEVRTSRDPRELGHFFAQWTRRTFKFGLVALLAGLGLAILPQRGSGVEVDLRWAASYIIFAACFCQAVWMVSQLKQQNPPCKSYWILPEPTGGRGRVIGWWGHVRERVRRIGIPGPAHRGRAREQVIQRVTAGGAEQIETCRGKSPAGSPGAARESESSR